MRLICAKDYEDVSRKAANIIAAQIQLKPDCVLGLATGSSPIGTYKQLIAKYESGDLDFSKVRTVNLDEYVGLDGSHPQSYRYFMDSHLFNLVDIDKTRTHVPCGVGVTDEMAAHYDDEIKQAGGVDLQLLGIGPNGHIGFNEPGTPWDAVTHIVPLTDATRQANKRFFNSIDEVPEKAVSMGIKTVMQSRRIILMAFGKNKAQAVKGMIEGRIDNSVPASILQLHPDCTVYIDDDAASML